MDLAVLLGTLVALSGCGVSLEGEWNGHPFRPVTHEMQVLRDTAAVLTPETARAHSNWTPGHERLKVRPNEVLWVRWELVRPGPLPEERPILSVRSGRIDSVESYLYVEDTLIRRTATGLLVDNSSRPFPDSRNSIPLLHDAPRQQVLLRLRSATARSTVVQLFDEASFMEWTLSSELRKGLWSAMLVGLGLYFLLFAVRSRQRAPLFFGIYAAFNGATILLYEGLLQHYFLTEGGTFHQVLTAFTSLIFTTAQLLLLRDLLELPTQLPRVDRLVRWCYAVPLLPLVVAPWLDRTQGLGAFVLWLGGWTCTAAIILAFLVARRRRGEDLLVLLAFSPYYFLIANEVSASWGTPLFPSLEFSNFYEAASLWSALGFALILGRRELLGRKQAQQREEQMRVTLLSIGDGVITTDRHGRITAINPVAQALTGWSEADATGRRLPEVFRTISGETRAPCEDPAEKVLRLGKIVGLANHTLLLTRDGRELQIADSGAPIRSAKGEILGVVLVFQDVTERYRLEDRLRQSEKMTSIGQLAGGIAHDFNNILSGVLGATELLALRLGPGNAHQEVLDVQVEAAMAGSSLAKRLLDFARPHAMEHQVLDLQEVLESGATLLRRAVDPRVQIECRYGEGRPSVQGDRHSLENALLNLGLNARDAMPQGGVLTIATRLTEVDDAQCRNSLLPLTPGRYVELTVSDTGCGMSPEVCKRIFEPFFTTKGPGKGTGLGLASVYGCVREHRGTLSVQSEPDRGTRFTLLLPLHSGDGAEATRPNEIEWRSQGEVLLADDELILRYTGAELLSTLGFQVTCVQNGAEAVELVRRDPQRWRLVVLDLMMPVMRGEEAFALLIELRPELPILFASGFTPDEDFSRYRAQGLKGFLRKPYLLADLRAAVREALGE